MDPVHTPPFFFWCKLLFGHVLRSNRQLFGRNKRVNSFLHIFLQSLTRHIFVSPRASVAMTSEAFDLANLKSWQEAFEYPLGTTRQIETGLRGEIANNKDRLRSLVGYILLTQRSRMLTLMSRRQGKLPRSPEYRRKDHTSRCINARDRCLNVNVKPQLQFGCYRKDMPNSCTAEAGASG